MLFQVSLIEDIISGKKTMTRRPWKGYTFLTPDAIYATKVFSYRGIDPIGQPATFNGHRDRVVYRVGQTYAVQPGRGKRGIWWMFDGATQICDDTGIYSPGDGLRYNEKNIPIAFLEKKGYHPLRIEIVSLHHEDARAITEADARAEGFADRLAFWKVWTGIYDKRAFKVLSHADAKYLQDSDAAHVWLMDKFAAPYDCVVIEFKVAL